MTQPFKRVVSVPASVGGPRGAPPATPSNCGDLPNPRDQAGPERGARPAEPCRVRSHARPGRSAAKPAAPPPGARAQFNDRMLVGPPPGGLEIRSLGPERSPADARLLR
jgi:hypothetical protein